MLAATEVVKSFGGFQALSRCSLEIERGTVTGIIGPNGAGKSTLFNVLAGVLEPDSGGVSLKGRSLLGLRPDQRAKTGLMRTFQLSRELRGLTVLENMLLASPHQSGDSAWRCFATPGRVREEQDAAIARARELLEHVDLWRLANEPAANLSGGQKKLLEISRALMHQPEIILLDEPAAGVNPTLLEFIIGRVQALNAGGKSILLIEHNMDLVARLCRRVLVMASGRLLCEGAPAEVARNPAVIEAYLGDVA